MSKKYWKIFGHEDQIHKQKCPRITEKDLDMKIKFDVKNIATLSAW